MIKRTIFCAFLFLCGLLVVYAINSANATERIHKSAPTNSGNLDSLYQQLVDFDNGVNASVFIGNTDADKEAVYIAPGDEIKSNMNRLYSTQYRVTKGGISKRIGEMVAEGKEDYLKRVFLQITGETTFQQLFHIVNEYEVAVGAQYPNKVTVIWYRMLGDENWARK